MRRILAAVTLAVWLVGSAVAAEIGFLEQFSLADDRAVPLKELIPGTKDYYYYTCLHHQNQGRLDEVEKLLPLWIERHHETARVREIQHRQALLLYDKDPKKALAFLRKRLGLHFDHQRETLEKKVDHPTRLDPNLISRTTLTKQARAQHSNLQGFEDDAFDFLVAMQLNSTERRHLLQRLRRPDYPNLPRLVVDDLKTKYSRGFGSVKVHRQMLRAQLDECLTLMPDLLQNTAFIHTYVTKLRPNPDVDWQNDPAARQAYLERLWAFVQRLAPAHNSLKAHVLYHRLVHDRNQGTYDKDRFLTYVKLPRRASYVEPVYLKDPDRRRHAANLSADYRNVTALPRVQNDEPLVRDYLEHFFVREDSYEPYTTYIRDTYLKEVFAETKIVHGLGDMEKWYSMLSPAKYQALKERVDLDFAPTNRTFFRSRQPVALDLHVKNVKKLIVKVFQINAFNYYRDQFRHVGTDVNLDGLVANRETDHTYDEVALRRVKRTFTFPSLRRPGVYVVEFIGNGKSSRALVRKGQLRFLEEITTAGHVFTVLDERNRHLKDAAIWLGGHKYEADNDGTITIPFTNKPGRQAIILTHGDFAWLDHFQHQAEKYRLVAGIHVDREALVAGRTAEVLVRPALYLHHMPVTLSVLEGPQLVIESVDRENVRTTKTVPDFKLFEDRAATYAFKVPDNLTSIRFTLKARVKNLSRNEKVDVSAGRAFTLNGIDKTDKIEDLHLSHVGGTYVLELLGKTGEVKPGRPVYVDLKHRAFRRQVHVALQTDADGRVHLGRLKDISRLRARGPQGTAHTWHLLRDRHTYSHNLHARPGEALHVPYMGDRTEPDGDAFSLLEVRGGTFVKDRRDALSVKNGFLEIKGLPRGDYDLLLKESGTHIQIRLADGERRAEYVLAENRLLETRNRQPLQIVDVKAEKETVTVRLANSSRFARVHVFATRFMPVYSAYADLGALPLPEPEAVHVGKPESAYLSGRDIGDEYRYILERKYAKKFPGNMLQRPGLLLNPWVLRKTETERQLAKGGEGWGGRHAAEKKRAARRFGVPAKGPEPTSDTSASLDFLKTPAVVLANLKPDENGVVTVQRKDLGDRQQIRIVAVDPRNTVFREIALPGLVSNFADLRLVSHLDPQKHYTQQQQVSTLQTGRKFSLRDLTTSEMEVYDSLPKVYTLYLTLSNNEHLREFAFLLEWPKLKPEDKRAKYSKYACHELHFFLSQKDPDFFKAVVLPYLKNKKDKTFLDHYLIGADLSPYLKPWAFARLNIVERILLTRRLEEQQKPIRRHVRELWELIPPNVERQNHLFKTALRGRALETAGLMPLLEAADELRSKDAELAVRREALGRLARNGAPAKAPAEAKPQDRKEAAKAEAEEKADRGYFRRDADRRRAVRQFYRKLDKTKEWAENNYYHLSIEQQDADLVTVNSFWKDVAAHDGDAPFVSPHLAEASRNFPEIMFALALLDLPFESKEHASAVDGRTFSLTAAGPIVVYHKEINPAQQKEKTPILVSQNFFKHNDRYRYVNNVKLDKYVTDEFVVHTVYGCQVVVTNPTSSRQKLDVLLQIPRGSIPVLNGFTTRSIHLDLKPYSTRTFDYHFYFPAPGDLPHYPVHVAKNEDLIGFAKPVTLHVVDKPSKIDKTSWDYVSQHGTGEQVLEYLQTHNLQRTKLSRIAFRMRDRDYFRKTVDLLRGQHAYDHTLWSYALYHNETAAARQYLKHSPFADQCGLYIDCTLLTLDPVVRRTYQHLEYRPLVNARTHRLGKTRRIVNQRLYQQYMRLMKVLSYRPKLDDTDRMAVTYYLLLQDRIEKGIAFFRRVEPDRLATRPQYDYFDAYVDFFSADHRRARAIANKYKEYPVDRWRKLFDEVRSQLDEIEGKAPQVVDDKDRTQRQTRLAATEPALDFNVEARKVTLHYQNLNAVTINYYLMDIELLFSRNPFVQHYAGQFAYIRPNETRRLALPDGKDFLVFDLPAEFRNKNVMIEIRGKGVQKSQAYYAHSLKLQMVATYGRIHVADAKTGRPLPKVYVKVYARIKGGRVRFYKDGYTDLRGRFDYTSLNTNELDRVEKFSLLIMSETHGAVIREAEPPKQ
jgi:hypothetical protein